MDEAQGTARMLTLRTRRRRFGREVRAGDRARTNMTVFVRSTRCAWRTLKDKYEAHSDSDVFHTHVERVRDGNSCSAYPGADVNLVAALAALPKRDPSYMQGVGAYTKHCHPKRWLSGHRGKENLMLTC